MFCFCYQINFESLISFWAADIFSFMLVSPFRIFLCTSCRHCVMLSCFFFFSFLTLGCMSYFWYQRVTGWRVTTPWLTATTSSSVRCVTETRCLKSLSRRKTFCGGTGALVYPHGIFWREGRNPLGLKIKVILMYLMLFQTRLRQYARDPSQDPPCCEMELQRWDCTGKLRFLLLSRL